MGRETWGTPTYPLRRTRALSAPPDACTRAPGPRRAATLSPGGIMRLSLQAQYAICGIFEYEVDESGNTSAVISEWK